MCCSSGGEGDELERVLNKMLDIMDDESYDYLIIETSGLVDPTPILQTFFTQEMRGGRYELDAVITLVDAKNIGRHLKGGRWGVHTPEAERQISLADVVVINK
jgi:G3E family GTPase